MMIKTFKKFMDIELNATSTAEHSKVPKGGPSGSAARNQRYAQLQLRYRFWIWLSICKPISKGWLSLWLSNLMVLVATIWTAMFAAIMVYSSVAYGALG